MAHPIISYNTDRKVTNLLQILNMTRHNHVETTALCLQDTCKLKPEELKQIIKETCPHYELNTTESHKKKGYKQTRLCTLINSRQIKTTRNEPPIRIETNNTASMITTAYKTTTTTTSDLNRPIMICNTYIRPRASHREVKQLMDNIIRTIKNISQGKQHFIIITGDFNATSTKWESNAHLLFDNNTNEYTKAKETRGKLINNIANRHNLIILNQWHTGQTYTNKNLKTGSQIDLALVNSHAFRHYHKVSAMVDFDKHDNLGIGHNPIIIGNDRNIQPTMANIRTTTYNKEHHLEPSDHQSIIQQEVQLDEHTDKVVEQNRRVTLTTNIDTNKKRTAQRIRYDLICEEHFDEAKLRTCSLFNNWQRCNRDQIITRMNTAAEILMESLLRAQNKVTTNKLTMSNNKMTTINKSLTSGDTHKAARIIDNISKQIKTLYMVKHKNHRKHNMTMKARSQAKRVKDEKRRKALIELRKKAKNKLISSIIKQSKANIIQMNKGENSEIDICNTTREDEQQDLTNIWKQIKSTETFISNARKSTQHIRLDIRQSMVPPDQIQTEYNNQRDSILARELIRTQKDIEQLAISKFPQIHRNLRPTDNINTTTTVTTGYDKHEPTMINQTEIDTAHKSVRNKLYTGPNGLKFKTLTTAATHCKTIIDNICKMSYWSASIPKCYQTTQGTIIPKKTTGKFRIVHVANPLSAHLEIIALNRLQYRLQQVNGIDKYQFGFTALRSRHDLIACLIEDILEYRIRNKQNNKNCKTTIFSIDVEGAFDNVNHDILIHILHKRLRNDTIKWWLQEFLLDRKIIIKYKPIERDNNDDDKPSILRSKSISICKGVPQGSALGPILWNLFINQIGDNIATGANEAKILAYADDIIVVCHDANRKHNQETLDKVIRHLKDLDLTVNADKTEYMTIKARSRTAETAVYLINGKQLKRTKKLNILGIPITNKLRLDTKDEVLKSKIVDTINKLQHLNKLGLVKTAKQWNIILNATLNSIIRDNYLPILAIDKDAAIWADNTLNRAMKLIFDWTRKIPNKIILLITKSQTTRVYVQKQTAMKKYTEYGQAYDLLHDINNTQYTNIEQFIEITPIEKIQSSTISKALAKVSQDNPAEHIRPIRYHDPETRIRITRHNSAAHDDKPRPQWVIIESCPEKLLKMIEIINMIKQKPSTTGLTDQLGNRVSRSREEIVQRYDIAIKLSTSEYAVQRSRTQRDTKMAAAVLLDKDTTPRHIIAARNTDYPTAYFNTLTLISNLTRDECSIKNPRIKEHYPLKNKVLTIHEDNPIIQAICNHDNHDWKIIGVRNRLYQSKWHLNITNNKECISQLIEITCSKLLEYIPSDIIELSNADKEQQMHLCAHLSELPVLRIHTNKPVVYDYKQRNEAKKIHRQLVDEQQAAGMTKIMQRISPRHKSWQKMINYPTVTNLNLLMLTGMTARLCLDDTNVHTDNTDIIEITETTDNTDSREQCDNQDTHEHSSTDNRPSQQQHDAEQVNDDTWPGQYECTCTESREPLSVIHRLTECKDTRFSPTQQRFRAHVESDNKIQSKIRNKYKHVQSGANQCTTADPTLEDIFNSSKENAQLLINTLTKLAFEHK